MSCSGLTSVTIPNSVTSIGEGAFAYRSNLTSVIVENVIPLQISSDVFFNRANATLYVPVGSKAAYEDADYWNEFKEIIEMPANGDLNGDGSINGIDLVAQTNLIMTDQYNAAADLNNDAVVNGLDYVIMVNLIMSYTSAPAMQAQVSNRAASTVNMSIEDFDIKAGETKELFINLSNPNIELTLLQFDMRLPEGLSIAVEDGDYAIDIAGRTTWKKHSLSTSSVNGATRFLLASQSNTLITGTSGAIISIKLIAANTFNGGDITLEGQLIVTPTEEATHPADYTYHIAGASGEKCATPTITNNNGTLTFACETAGAVCHYKITRAGEGNTVQLSSTADYVVSVWATKAGYLDSDVATTTITMKRGDVNADGVVSITDAVSVVNIINSGF